MLRFGLLICVCVFFLGCALLFAFGSAGSPCLQYIPSAVLFAAPIGLAGLIEVFLRQLVCTPYIYIYFKLYIRYVVYNKPYILYIHLLM